MSGCSVTAAGSAEHEPRTRPRRAHCAVSPHLPRRGPRATGALLMANTTIHGWILIGLFIVLTFAMAKPFGSWLFAIYEGRVPRFLGFLAPVERMLYRAGGVDETKEQGWRRYAIHMLLF